MPAILNQLGLPAVLVVGAIFIVWFVAGNELMRRRGRSLAIWSKRALDPLGGRQAIQWITLHSFRLEIEGLKPPFTSGTMTGLVESWDVPITWLINRLNGRRDMVLVQLALRQQPIRGIELFRLRSLLAGDARQMAAEEGWTTEPFEEFQLAAMPGATPQRLASELLAALGPRRADLLRLALRRRGLHLTLALNIPDRQKVQPAELTRLLQGVAAVALRYATPAEATD
jgi:hypothetical protein